MTDATAPIGHAPTKRAGGQGRAFAPAGPAERASRGRRRGGAAPGSGGDPAVVTATPHGMGDSVTPHAQNPGPRDFRYLCAGIDTLDLGFYVDWQSRLLDLYPLLEHQRERACEGKTAILRHDILGEAVVYPSSKRNYRWQLHLRDGSLWLANCDTPNKFPNVYASPHAETLWTKGPQEAVEAITALLAELGAQVLDVQVSRADLAADFAIPDGLSLHFLREHRVSRVQKTNQHEEAGVLETLYVAKRGAPLQARIYNKLLKATQEPRTAFILAIWGGPLPGWRIEFQLRRAALRSFGISSLDDLRTKAGGLWAYLTGSWLSFRLHDDKKAERRTVHPWWQHVQACAADFGPACTLSREASGVPKAPSDWYVSHMAGCLVPFAAREDLRRLDDALKEFDERARAYWAQKCWEDEYTKRRIQLGRLTENGGDHAPF